MKSFVLFVPDFNKMVVLFVVKKIEPRKHEIRNTKARKNIFIFVPFAFSCSKFHAYIRLYSLK